MTRFLELWSLGVIWDGEDGPPETVRSSDGRAPPAAPLDPRTDECKRLGCMLGVGGTVEHVALDGSTGCG